MVAEGERGDPPKSTIFEVDPIKEVEQGLSFDRFEARGTPQNSDLASKDCLEAKSTKCETSIKLIEKLNYVKKISHD